MDINVMAASAGVVVHSGDDWWRRRNSVCITYAEHFGREREHTIYRCSYVDEYGRMIHRNTRDAVACRCGRKPCFHVTFVTMPGDGDRVLYNHVHGSWGEGAKPECAARFRDHHSGSGVDVASVH